MEEKQKRNRPRQENSLRDLAQRFGTSPASIRRIAAVKAVIGDEELHRQASNGVPIGTLYRKHVEVDEDTPAWVSSASRLQKSIHAAKKRGEWTDEDQGLLQYLIDWLIEERDLEA